MVPSSSGSAQQPLDVVALKPPKPGAPRPRRRQSHQPGQSRQHRVRQLVAQVPHTPVADQDQPEQGHRHRRHAEVRRWKGPVQRSTHQGRECRSPRVLPDQFQSGMRGDLLAAHPEVASTVDATPQVCSSRSHWGGLLWTGPLIVCNHENSPFRKALPAFASHQPNALGLQVAANESKRNEYDFK